MRTLLYTLAALSILSTGASTLGQTAPANLNNARPSTVDRCQRLTQLKLQHVSISTATAVPAGGLAGPPQAFTGRDLSEFYKKLPPFCRIVAHARPSSDSDIEIELWMPFTGWNGKLQGLGNGGFAGLIDTFEMGAAVSKGYAAVATDAGHIGSPIDATWALGHPEKIVDFGHRAIHEMTWIAKDVAQQFYGTAPKRAYFAGCSDGGREALMEAQRYPDDYDGILAGAPANAWNALLAMAVVDTQALTATPESFIPQAKIPALESAVLAACDSLDGVADGILNDPRQCRFDPASIQCTADDNDKCLTAGQVAALKQIYAGIRDAQGQTILPGYLPGAEAGPGGWGIWITGPAPTKSLMAFFGIDYFSDMVYDKPDWDFHSFVLEPGLQAAREKNTDTLDAVNPDLSKFRARGGKLILYHGWGDPAIPALSTVSYWNQVVAKLGQADTDSFARFYLLPGVQHCGGGPGPDVFGQSAGWGLDDPQHNVRVALENWAEKGIAPGTIIATKTAPGAPEAAPSMTRPLCPYPQAAKYDGSGDPNKAESFTCVSAK